MKHAIRVVFALALCLVVILCLSSCGGSSDTSNDEPVQNGQPQNPSNPDTPDAPSNPDTPNTPDTPDTPDSPSGDVDLSSCKVIDGEVFAYDRTGARLTYDRSFVQAEGNTYYAIHNIVVTGHFVIEGVAYSFDEAGVKQDTVLDRIFVECENATYYIINNVVVYNQIVIDGAIYDFGTDGKMVVGEKDGYTYGEDGKLVGNGVFVTVGDDIYYVINNVIVYNQIVINGAIYNFGNNGKMVVGNKNGQTYGQDGRLVADKLFVRVGNATYYVINNVIVYNKIVIDGAVYDFGTDGRMTVGEKDGYTYGQDGKMTANGAFIYVNGSTYYVMGNAVVYNRMVINNHVYDFGTDGKMTVGNKDGLTFDTAGRLVANELVISIGGKTYYVVNNVIVRNTFVFINNRIYFFTQTGERLENGTQGGYYFGPEGYLQSDTPVSITIGGKTYYVTNGVAQENTVSSMSGTVFESDGDRDPANNPLLSGVSITLSVGGQNYTATTGADGKFSFSNLSSGTGTLTLTLNGYITVTTTVTVSGEQTLNLVMDRQVSNNLSGKVVVADADNTLSNNSALSGATVTLERTTSTNIWRKTTTTGSDGSYYFEGLTAGMYKLVISKDGYITIEQTVQVRYNEANVYNIALEAIPQAAPNSTGAASGQIIDARTGSPVSGLTVYIFSGINNIDGAHLAKLTTDASGYYSVANLAPGNYTAYVVDERTLADEDARYGSLTIPVKVLANQTVSNQGGTVSNSIGLSIDGMRIVLTWGSTPSDLDSHLTFGSYHVYYSQKTHGSCSLDVDDTSAYGPETVTISSIGDYTYKYYVHNYSGSGTMSNAQACVQVYFGNSSTAAYTFYPPTGSGYNWDVFTYNGVTGEFTVLNTLRS